MESFINHADIFLLTENLKESGVQISLLYILSSVAFFKACWPSFVQYLLSTKGAALPLSWGQYGDK